MRKELTAVTSRALVRCAFVALALSACYPPRTRWVGMNGRTVGVTQETGDSSPKPAASADTAPPEREPETAECIIESPRGRETLLLGTYAAWSAVPVDEPLDGPDPEAAPGVDGVRVPDGSTCELIEQKGELSHVRVVSGPAARTSGWVDSSAVRR